MPFLSKIRLNGTLYDLKVAGDAMVTGVKGDAESDYRVGDVNITPEDVGTISTEDTQSLTDTQKSTARDNLGLGSAATRSVPASGNANATQVVLGSDTRLTGSYKTDDTASTTINDTDYVPMSEADGTKKKTLWSTIVAKVKAALGIASSGSTYLKKDGTWGTPANTTYTFATGDSNGQIKVTPSGGSAQNVSVKGLGSAAYTASTAYAAASHTHNYAASPSAGGAASNVYTPRVNTDYNADLPGANKTKVVEHSSTSPNRPENHWFYVVTMQGGDTGYATQIAYGMTTNANYCRRMQGGTWGAWKAFRNPTGNATAAQVLSGYTASNASSDGFSGSMPYKDYRGQYPALATGHNDTGSYVYIPYGYYAPVENGDRTWFYLTNAQAQNMHKHTATWTPSSSKYNSTQAEIAEYHSYRYVNTAVCYSAGQNAVSNADTYLFVTNGPTTVISEYSKRGAARGIYLKADGSDLQGSPTLEILEWGTWKVLHSYYIKTQMSKTNGYYYATFSSNIIGLVRIQFAVAAGQAIWYHFTY